jgi:hypothetical protein
MAEARTRSVRIRGRAAGLFAAGYVVALTSFWVAGAVAYAESGHGLSRLLGLAYFPILLLPVVGKGTLGGLEVHGAIWVWWFALQMILGAAAIWLNPYERPHRLPPRFGVRRAGASRARSLARMPRTDPPATPATRARRG